jgi:carbamoyl-phosphate synthase large subunit
MALSGRLACRTSTALRQARITPSAGTASYRTFTTVRSSSLTTTFVQKQQPLSRQQYRAFSQCLARKVQSQEAPNAQAYLASGVIAGARNTVDVSKVLVIGSGGLSIGQAGEFDYSGE